ncbi:dolichyl-phosphate beta-glucosyltransferase [Streptomyces similanensis]|uniref:dolichyl-phosphate beta-glucosyltransferase n=1 Tax=Streptomyces similanensis TaxID=1274988 RepID=A0ABP9LCK3_9ACTN
MTETGLDASPGTGRPPLPGPRRTPIPALPAHHPDPVIDIVVPVFNEEADLEPGVRRLHAHLRATFPYPFRITVADNASTDDTPRIAARLADELPEARWLRLTEKGRGRALRTAWSRSDAPVLAYLDVDLSTELTALLPLVAPLVSGHSDIAIGTRLAPGARVVRGPKREVVSRCYNVILRTALGVGFSDAQCGFKAVRREAAERLLPLVRDPEWFFDTELLVLAERAGLRIHEVPVDWVDDPDSRVDLLPTALADLRGIARIARRPARTALLPAPAVLPPATRARRFAAAAALAALAHLLLYAALRPATGAQSANALAVLVCALAGPAAHRRLTLPVALLLTGGTLAALHHAAPSAAHRTELAALAAADLAVALLRSPFLRTGAARAASRRRRTGAAAR